MSDGEPRGRDTEAAPQGQERPFSGNASLASQGGMSHPSPCEPAVTRSGPPAPGDVSPHPRQRVAGHGRSRIAFLIMNAWLRRFSPGDSTNDETSRAVHDRWHQQGKKRLCGSRPRYCHGSLPARRMRLQPPTDAQTTPGDAEARPHQRRVHRCLTPFRCAGEESARSHSTRGVPRGDIGGCCVSRSTGAGRPCPPREIEAGIPCKRGPTPHPHGVLSQPEGVH